MPAIAVSSDFASSGIKTSPLALSRSLTPKRNSRGASGSGGGERRS
jgi:hypothetical protein